MWGKGNSCALLIECKVVNSLWKMVQRFLKKKLTELPHDPTIPLLGIYMKNIKIQTVKDTCIHIFICNSQATEKN